MLKEQYPMSKEQNSTGAASSAPDDKDITQDVKQPIEVKSCAGKRSLSDDPFSDLKLSSHAPLQGNRRTPCPGQCGKSRRYYCAECIKPLVVMPNIALPLQVHVLQAGAERPQRSTAQHVALLAPAHATVWRPFPECSDAFRTGVLEGAPLRSVAVLYVDKLSWGGAWSS